MVKVEKGPRMGKIKGPGGDAAPSKFGSTQNMSANVKVVVRVRPLNEKEQSHSNRIVVDVVDDRMLVFDPREDVQAFFYQGVQQPNKNYLKRANKELKFVFDHVIGQGATNKEVFEVATKDMLSSLMEGYNCSVFVYGATGAGKTFTMIGNQENLGITYLTMEHLFYTINSFEKDRDFDIGVSYLEVYNENVYDLIKPSKSALQLREDSKYGVMVAGLTMNSIKTAKELLNILENGNKNRTQHPTDANAESSRSHAVFQVYIKMSYKTSSQVRMVKLSMIDLAGSERASATGCVGERFKEGANINKSLLSLANCINKLADGCGYIPYRDSKLTRLLKDSLGGNCKTVMIANISPAATSYDDTYNTLKYADRANKIQLSIKKNIVDGGTRVAQYVKINEELKKKVKELEAKLTLSCVAKADPEADAKLVKMNDDLQKKVKELEEKVFLSGSKNSVASSRHLDRVCSEWRGRVCVAGAGALSQQSALAALAAGARVRALRHRRRARTQRSLAALVHRASSDAMQQMCNEDIPRQERASEKYSKDALRLDAKVMCAWNKWNESQKTMNQTCAEALEACPQLKDCIEAVQLQTQLNHAQAQANLSQKLLSIQNEEINAFSDYMTDMASLLKKLYLTLKGYDKVTPNLTAEYMNIMKKAKSSKGISWSDDDVEPDTHLKFIANLDLDNPLVQENLIVPDITSTDELITDSEDLTDQENREPLKLSAKKRKGTPVKFVNNETIIIDDSIDNLDVTRTVNSAKKLKMEYDPENMFIKPLNLNSTFDMERKIDNLKKQIKTEHGKEPTVPVKQEFADKTNTMQRSINFGDRARIAKPVVAKVEAFRRGPPLYSAGPRAPGFGSSLSRDGTPLLRTNNNIQEAKKASVTQKSVGFKAVRARDRVQAHPYTRPARK